MTFSELNDKITPIRCFDPLGGLLGSFENGEVEYDFLYAVKLAGHGCPTVLCSFLSADKVAKTLYPDGRLVRGDVKIEIKNRKDEATAGVSGSIFSAIFGASDEGGFKGLGGVYARDRRLFFGSDITTFAKFTRLDNNKTATLDFDFSQVQRILGPDLSSALQGYRNGKDISEFQSKWLEKMDIIASNFDALGVAVITTSDSKI